MAVLGGSVKECRAILIRDSAIKKAGIDGSVCSQEYSRLTGVRVEISAPASTSTSKHSRCPPSTARMTAVHPF
eukprot:m.167818 g.167818  ORF g.167818 m.167818 type:complete len:73 (-) comp53182_c0_seq15:419-637(-)